MAAKADSSEGEIREDFLGRVAILAPGRAKRPHDFKAEVPKKTTPKSKCFFCPGNENLTPPEIERTSLPSKKGWQNRVFSNKFPALNKGWHRAYGMHEVLVETPEHSKTLSQLSENEIFLYLKMAAKRLKAHAKDKKIKYTSIFKNEWEAAGASLEHTHTQLVGMPFVPPYVKQQQKACKKPCHFCSINKNKKFPKIYSNSNFTLLCPYVSKYKYELWIVPKKHIGSIVDMDDKTLLLLAQILSIALKTQDSYLGYPPYNILFHLSPHHSKGFHMHLSITPRIAKWAGFEHQTGVIMNSVRPEIAAEEYKVNLIK